MAIIVNPLVFILCLLSLALFTHAEENALGGIVRVGILPFSPINYVDKDGSAKGLNPDLLRKIFRDDATHLEFVPGSWAEGLKRLEDEEIDLMMSGAYSDERAKDPEWDCPSSMVS